MSIQSQTRRRRPNQKTDNGHHDSVLLQGTNSLHTTTHPQTHPHLSGLPALSEVEEIRSASLAQSLIEPGSAQETGTSVVASWSEEPDTERVMQELRLALRNTSQSLEQLLLQLTENELLHHIQPEAMLHSLRQVDLFLHKPSFVIGFAGGFNAGKSMLINALLGEQLLKDGAVPTTSTVTRIVACPPGEEQMRIHFFTPQQFEELFARYYEDFKWLYHQTTEGPPPHGRDSLTELLDDLKFLREQLESADWSDKIRSLDSFYDLIVAYINHHHLLQQGMLIEALTRKTLNTYTTKSENSVAPLVREVQLAMNHPMLAQGSQLIDLPGLGSPDPRDEEITVAALRGDTQSGKRECDAVVHVMDALSPFRAGEDRLFQIYRKVWGETFARRVFLVISRWGKLERYNADEMLAVGNTVQKVAERYGIDRRKLFIVDGRIGSSTETMTPAEIATKMAEQGRELQHLRTELESCLLPSGQDLFEVTLRVLVDGNVSTLRESMQYYLATYKELLHLNDALRLLDNLVNKLHQAASLELPPIDQLEDDEQQFIEQCRGDFDRQLKLLRHKIRNELPVFLQDLLQDTILPRDLTGLCESLYQSIARDMETQNPEQLQQQLLTHQLSQAGPLTSPIPWESFRFLFQKAVQRLDRELEEFCGAVSHQTIFQYRRFLFEELGLLDIVERAFGSTPQNRETLQPFQSMLQQLERDLQLVARNLNRVFFYEYSDISYRRDANDARIDIRKELEEYLGYELNHQPVAASRATRWLLRHKMEYHFGKLSTFLPLCILQQIQETHQQLHELLEEASYRVRQAYLERLERREIGQEVDRIRHHYRQTRACLEQLATLREQTQHARQLLQQPILQRES